MRKIWHGRILALLLSILLVYPAVALADSFSCFHKPHHCASVPAPLRTGCCLSAADIAQPPTTVGLGVAYGPAPVRQSVGAPIAIPRVAQSGRRAPSPPIDRLSRFGVLLI